MLQQFKAVTNILRRSVLIKCAINIPSTVGELDLFETLQHNAMTAGILIRELAFLNDDGGGKEDVRNLHIYQLEHWFLHALWLLHLRCACYSDTIRCRILRNDDVKWPNVKTSQRRRHTTLKFCYSLQAYTPGFRIPLIIGSLRKHYVDGSENVIWKCNFSFLQSFLNYSRPSRLQNVF